MLTRADRTVSDALVVLEEVRSLGLTHIGFKDVGIEPAAAAELHRKIKELGATSYFEVVSTSAEDGRRSVKLARELGVDRVLGGTRVEEALAILAGSGVRYLPFPGKPSGHPTQLHGSAEDVAADCRRFEALGVAGVDLLAYRTVDADPLELVRAARQATDGILLVAGGIGSRQQVQALATAGVDAFTVGSAVFDGSFAPAGGPLRAQLKAVVDACS